MKWQQQGFSLFEMAVALVVSGLTFFAMPPLLQGLAELNQAQSPAGHQQQVRQALVGHLVSHDRLPCPDLDADGREDCGTGASQGGVPWRSLGLTHPPRNPSGFELTYAVATILTAPPEAFSPLLPPTDDACEDCYDWDELLAWHPDIDSDIKDTPLARPAGKATDIPAPDLRNGLDICRALTQEAVATHPAQHPPAVQAWANHATDVPVAAALVDPGPDGRLALANRASPYVSPACPPSQTQQPGCPPAAHEDRYDDRVDTIGFNTLSALLDCPILISRINTSARDAFAAEDLARTQQWFEHFRRLHYEISYMQHKHNETSLDLTIAAGVIDTLGSAIGLAETGIGPSPEALSAVALTAYSAGMAVYTIKDAKDSVKSSAEDKRTAKEQLREASSLLEAVITDRDQRIEKALEIEHKGWFQ
ncbi:type II secretion system protein [Marichromatium bheemlicum]|uniref:Prepilin-type N-terminal cleavage/methylation domain-containing protein n=1 Tax=Marichromatium bheemlicum TaxID=365339 RepID=A0ABX1I498_9GAMM|nr:hypothetical protein [Marichromatium bheemlicum]NKN32379.1 hypothetical protein [Marichromatium bheemlicum]